MQGYPNHGGYPHGYPPPPPQKQGVSPLVIVLLVMVAMLVVGGGGCLVCVGIAAVAGDAANREALEAGVGSPTGSGVVPGTTADGELGRDGFARDLETKLRTQGIPATSVRCPAQHPQSFTCQLTVGADEAPLEVRDTGSGYAFEVPNTAFLDAGKLAATFATSIAKPVDPRLRVPCFAGTLMKRVGSTFTCDVVLGAVKTGTVTTSVDSAQGNVHMSYAGLKAAPDPGIPVPAAGRPRVVDFACPDGQKPGGAVRAGCLCGDTIISTACGAPGAFTEVTDSPRGCRFTCAR